MSGSYQRSSMNFQFELIVQHQKRVQSDRLELKQRIKDFIKNNDVMNLFKNNPAKLQQMNILILTMERNNNENIDISINQVIEDLKKILKLSNKQQLKQENNQYENQFYSNQNNQENQTIIERYLSNEDKTCKLEEHIFYSEETDQLDLGVKDRVAKNLEEEFNKSTLEKQQSSDQVVNESRECLAKGQRGPYRRYTLGDKQLALKYVREHQYSVLQVSKVLAINPKNIRRWIDKGIQKKPGQGRKTSDPQMEKKLYKMIQEYRADNNSLPSKKVIGDFALMHSQGDRFKASKGWFDKFIKRYGFKLAQFRINRKKSEQTTE